MELRLSKFSWLSCFSFWLFAFAFSTSSYAHSLKVFAYFEGDKVKGSVYFAGGAPAKSAKISIRNPEGETLLKLTSDDDGQFVSPSISAQHVFVVADSKDGHQESWEVIRESTESSQTGVTDQESIRSSERLISSEDLEPLKDIVAEAVAEQVGPLREELHRYQHKARMSDVIGGIGFIFGIAGVVMWVKSRRVNP